MLDNEYEEWTEESFVGVSRENKDSEYNFYWFLIRDGMLAASVRAIKTANLVFTQGQSFGVAMQLYAQELTDKEEVEYAIKLISNRIGKKKALDTQQFLGDSIRAVYKGVPGAVWLKSVVDIGDGKFDVRQEQIRLHQIRR